ncbi:isopentenyl-diphosphate Delta-isomerase 1 [Hydra vulgaris]|uniref:isopentenyl-diphosphate Delta-isomerase n=1 Tax=Hydra vulgaris TaxID=6087 RepID=A0ABM4CY59_HYDVU
MLKFFSRSMSSSCSLGIFSNASELQIQQMNEKIVLVDENDKVLGSVSKRDSHELQIDGNSQLHRAFSVFLFNSKNELLLQQRSASKVTFPNYLTNTCCSHPRFNQEELVEYNHLGVKLAAQRRLLYELGILEEQVPIEAMHHLTRIHYFAKYNHHWAEHELDHVILIKSDVDLSNVNSDEVQHTQYVNQNRLRVMMDDKKFKATPWFRYIYDGFLFNWWSKLDDLSTCQDDLIHRAGNQTI